jgi:hypothetical protein
MLHCPSSVQFCKTLGRHSPSFDLYSPCWPSLSLSFERRSPRQRPIAWFHVSVPHGECFFKPLGEAFPGGHDSFPGALMTLKVSRAVFPGGTECGRRGMRRSLFEESHSLFRRGFLRGECSLEERECGLRRGVEALGKSRRKDIKDSRDCKDIRDCHEAKDSVS